MYTMPIAVILRRSYELLLKNPILLVPGLIGSLASATLQSLFFGATWNSGGVFHTFVNWLCCIFIATVSTLLVITAVTSMAGQIWEAGTASFDDGVRVFREAGNALYQTLLQLAGFMFLSLLLTPLTLCLSALAAIYLLVYAIPSAVVGGFSGFAAIRESVRIASTRAGQTVGILVTLALLLICFGCLALVLFYLGFVLLPVFICTIIGNVLIQAIVAYITLVVVGLYIEIRRIGD